MAAQKSQGSESQSLVNRIDMGFVENPNGGSTIVDSAALGNCLIFVSFLTFGRKCLDIAIYVEYLGIVIRDQKKKKDET